jgi:hypothetical protein
MILISMAGPMPSDAFYHTFGMHAREMKKLSTRASGPEPLSSSVILLKISHGERGCRRWRGAIAAGHVVCSPALCAVEGIITQRSCRHVVLAVL